MANSTNDSEPRGNFGTDAYVDWDMEMLRQDGLLESDSEKPPRVWMHPVFVRLYSTPNDDDELRFTPTIEALRKLKGEQKTGFETHELEYLETIKEYERNISEISGKTGIYDLEDSVYCFLYRKIYHVDGPEKPKLFEIINVGPVVHIELPDQQFTIEPLPIAIARSTILSQPVVAIIDDSIGFLNDRFSKEPIQGRNDWTRFRAFWYQAKESVPDLKPISRELDDYPSVSMQNFIDPRKLSIGVSFKVERKEGTPPVISDERTVYSFLDRYLIGTEDVNISIFSQSHGTSMLDIASGDTPGGVLNEVDLIGVQLPPHSVRDTSGKRFDSYILQGLRWIIDQTIRVQFERNDADLDGLLRVPLIVNISLGSYAGPKNGEGFLESQIRREIKRYDLLSQGAPIRVVLSFGNGYRNKQTVLFKSLEMENASDVDWCIMPDDRTASYVEMRASASTHLKVWIKPPGHSGAWYSWPEKSEYQSIRVEEIEVGRLYGDSNYLTEDKSRATIAILPTYRDDFGMPVASSGQWNLAFKNMDKNKSEKSINISLQIQRDDTPSPHTTAGRQSYFDHDSAHEWDPETRDYSMPSTDCPITRDATHGAQVSALDNDIYSVGAVYERTYGNECPVSTKLPSYYSAKGGDNHFSSVVEGPLLSAIADESRISPGINATGTMSGSTSRIGGTSAAAAQVTRALTMLFLASNSTPRTQKDELKALLDIRSLPNTADSRTGYGVLKEHSSLSLNHDNEKSSS